MSRKHDSAPVLAIKEISWHLLGLFVVDDLYVGWFFRFLLMFAGAQRTEKILGWLRFSSFFLSLSLSLSLSASIYLPPSPSVSYSLFLFLFSPISLSLRKLINLDRALNFTHVLLGNWRSSNILHTHIVKRNELGGKNVVRILWSKRTRYCFQILDDVINQYLNVRWVQIVNLLISTNTFPN